MTEEIIIDGIDVSEWTDEEVRYNFKKHSPKAIRQIAFDLYKQLKRKEQECEELKQTLTEIKDIAEEEVHTRMLFADKKSFCDFNKILQKISECEVE